MYEIILVVTMTIGGQDFLDQTAQSDIATCWKEAAQRWDRFIAIQGQGGEHDATGFGAGCVFHPPEQKDPPAE